MFSNRIEESFVTFNCNVGSFDSSVLYQLISVGADGYIYIICDVDVEPGKFNQILRVDPNTYMVEVRVVDIGNVQLIGDAWDDDAEGKVADGVDEVEATARPRHKLVV